MLQVRFFIVGMISLLCIYVVNMSTIRFYSIEFSIVYNNSYYVVHLSLGEPTTPKAQGDLGVTPETCVMFGERTLVDLVLGMGPQALGMPPTHRD
jgi:hypothetical protein